MDESSVGRQRALLAAGNLAVDGVTAEVVGALQARGVRSILLRGPAVGRWLYTNDEESLRTYDDLDLLIPPGDAERGERALEALGFINWFEALAPGEKVEHASEWRREASAVTVDLHHSLQGVSADPNELWEELAVGTDRIEVGKVMVEIPGEPGRVLVVVLHAAHHGIGGQKPLRDLEKVTELRDPELWRRAGCLAERLQATPAFAAGLMLSPEGLKWAEWLGIADAVDTEAALHARTPGPTAYGFARLAATPGLLGKLSFLWRKLLPTPAFMRHAFPIARRGGRIGLAIAYLWRPLWLLAHAGPGLIAWLRARR